MTPRTLFTIILKILGIFSIKDILEALPQFLSTILYLKEHTSEAIWTLVLSVLLLLVYGFVSYFLLFKSDYIIDKLKLNKGFDQETIPINIHRSTILSISVIVMGGLILADEIPNLCRQLFAYWQEKTMTRGLSEPSFSYSILAAAKVMIGFLLVSENRKIVTFIEFKRQNKYRPS